DLLQFPLLSSSADAAPSENVKTISAAIVDTVARLGEKISLSRAAALVSPAAPPASAPRRSETGTAAGGQTAHLASAYAHGGPAPAPASSAQSASAAQGYLLTSGRVASLVLTRLASPELPGHLQSLSSGHDANSSAPPSIQVAARALARSLARQVAGMETRSILPGPEDVVSLDGPPSTALYAQPFAMLLSAAAPQPESSSQAVADVLRAWGAAKGLGENAVEVQGIQRWEVGENVQREEKSAEGFAEEVRKAAGLA
ncbi:Elongation factor Ts, mitochondrial, partial [Tilletia horrida]